MISVVTPSVRPELLPIVSKCLGRQTFNDFSWLVVGPYENRERVIKESFEPILKGLKNPSGYIGEPDKRPGDFYNLNKAWNVAFKRAEGELIVNIVDGLWFEPTLLESLWSHYKADPKACIGAVGDQYDQEKNGKPEHVVWTDPRKRVETFYQVSPNEFELCIASIPLQAIKEVGGIDEIYDTVAALSEKEMCYRIEKLGYKFYLDQTLEYRAIKHPRLSESWDERYNAGCEIFAKHLQEIRDGTRLRLDFMENKEYKSGKVNLSEKEDAAQI